MNAGAAAYTPSPNLRSVAARVRSGASSVHMTPMVGPSSHSAAGTPSTGPSQSRHTDVHPSGVMPLPMSAADHFRQLHGVHAKKPPSDRSQAQEATLCREPPRVDVKQRHKANKTAPPSAQPQPQPRHVVRYSRDDLLAIQARAIDAIAHGPITDEPPFLKIPATFAPLLQRPFALEYLDVDAATALVECRAYSSPLIPASGGGGGGKTEARASPAAVPDTVPALTIGNEGTDVRSYHCAICSQGGAKPCPALAEVIRNATRYAMRTKEGACLLQSPEVVTGLLQLLLVFESKKSSMRMRLMAEHHPSIVRRITAFLCGEGYHLPLPSVTAHESWRTMMSLLKFDAIRDNRTRIIHDFSKHWKKRHTPFEQFVYFFGFRYAVPTGPAKNIPTCSVKPGMVAMLSGDVMAMVLLHHLNFFIPPGYYWSVYPYLHQALGEGTLAYDVIRHLGTYLSSQQDSSVFFNPIENPEARQNVSWEVERGRERRGKEGGGRWCIAKKEC